MTYVEMYINILNAFGSTSAQLQKYKEFYIMCQSNKKIMEKIYKIIMAEK